MGPGGTVELSKQSSNPLATSAFEQQRGAGETFSDASFWRFVQNYVQGAPGRKWISALSSLHSGTHTHPEGVDFAVFEARVHVDPANEEMAANKWGRALLTPIVQHQGVFTGRGALIRILCGNAGRDIPLPVDASPEKILGVNMTALEGEIAAKYSDLGAGLIRSTLYTIELGDARYHVVVIRGGFDKEGWAGFCDWHDGIKEKFGVNLRLVFDPGADVPGDSHAWRIPYLSTTTARERILLSRCGEFAIDLRDRPFFSVDGVTDLPSHELEDVIEISQVSRRGVHFRYGVPVQAAKMGSFKSSRENLAFVTEGFVPREGVGGYTNVYLALIRNHYPLNADPVSYVIERIGARARRRERGEPPLSPAPTAAERSIENNPEIFDQISQLSDLAASCRRKRLHMGSLVSAGLHRFDPAAGKLRKDLRAENAVGEITAFAHRAFGEWVLSHSQTAPFIMVRPIYDLRDELTLVRGVLPEAELADIFEPARRAELAKKLIALNRHDLVSTIAEALPTALVSQKYVVLQSPDDLQPYDTCRFKAAHRPAIGGVNQIQALSLLMGSPGFTPDELLDCVTAHNTKDREKKDEFATLLRRKIDDVHAFLSSPLHTVPELSQARLHKRTA